MRIILILLLTFLQLSGSLFAQNCKSEICITILNLKLELRAEQARQQEMGRNLLGKKAEIVRLEVDNANHEAEIAMLNEEITLLSENLVDANLNIDYLTLELNNVIEQLEEKEHKNAEEKKFLENLKFEIDQQVFINEGKDGEIQMIESDLRKVIKLHSRIDLIELGSGNKNKMVVTKKYKNGEDMYVPRFGDKLDLINYAGGLYLPKDQKLENLNGRLLIYADNDLVTSLDARLTETDEGFQTLVHYVLEQKLVKLSKPFPRDHKVRVGFVKSLDYLNYKEYFYKFWDAYNSDLFLITNIKPIISVSEDQSRNLIDNCDLKEDNRFTASTDIIYITLRDNADVDGDIAAIYLNGNKIIEKELQNWPSDRKAAYLLNGINRLVLVPVNEGSVGLCTVELTIQESTNLPKKILLRGTRNSTECVEIEKRN